MKRFILLLMAVLLVFAAAAAAEEPEAEPTDELLSGEAPDGEELPEEELPDGEELPDEEKLPDEENLPDEEKLPDGEELPDEEKLPDDEEPPAGEEPPVQENLPDGQEPPAEETPSAEELPAGETCVHEHTVKVYYFDAPDYRPMNDETHLVIGQAMVEVDCLDCGAVLSVSTETDAEEIRPHVFRNGLCVLCGREEAPSLEAETAPAPAESVLWLPSAGGPDQYYCSLTGRDLEGAADTLVLRPEGRDAALAIQTEKLREEIERAGGPFTAEIRKPGDRDVSALLCLYDAYGEEVVPEAVGFSLRIYDDNNSAPLTVTYTSLNGSTSSEEARWVKKNGDEGYWIVTWLGDGMYEYR